MPSTVNRVYAIVQPERPIFVLNVVAAAVLPLQGFFNLVIYAHASRAEVKAAWKKIKADPRRIFYDTPNRSNESAPPSISIGHIGQLTSHTEEYLMDIELGSFVGDDFVEEEEVAVDLQLAEVASRPASTWGTDVQAEFDSIQVVDVASDN